MAGLGCCVAHTRARWSDAAAVYEEHKADKDVSNEAIFVAAPTARTKTGNAPHRRRREQELAGRARGASSEPWAAVRPARRRVAGLQVSADSPLPQMLLGEPDIFRERPPRADEDGLIWRRLLTSQGVSPEDVRVLGTRGLKHTWLSGAKRAGWPPGTRRSLGYHTTLKDRGTLEYGGDEPAAPLRALEELRRATGRRRLDPDLTRSGVWAA